LLGVAKDVFNDTRAFDPSNGMLNSYAHSRNTLIVLLLSVGQLALAWLFFGWYVWQRRGS
jgi:hypothetical protein